MAKEREFAALEAPLRRGLILRLMSVPSSNKRTAALEDPTKPDGEQTMAYHDDMLLEFAIRGVGETLSQGGSYTQSRGSMGSAVGRDAADNWLLGGNTLLGSYGGDKFRFRAMQGIYTSAEVRSGEGATLAEAYDKLNEGTPLIS